MMNPAYKEILSDEDAASRIHPNFKGWGREVAVFGDVLDEKGAQELKARIKDRYCAAFCRNNEYYVQTGKCSAVHIQHSVKGEYFVIAQTRGRRFTRKSQLANCNDGLVY